MFKVGDYVNIIGREYYSAKDKIYKSFVFYVSKITENHQYILEDAYGPITNNKGECLLFNSSDLKNAN